LSRVIYISGFSKTITPTLRVGYVAAHAEVLADLARTKMAVGLTSSEVTERIVSNVLSEGHYARHIDFLKEKLRVAHTHVVERMQSLGMEIFQQPSAGLFLMGEAAHQRRAKRTCCNTRIGAGHLACAGLLFSSERSSRQTGFALMSPHPTMRCCGILSAHLSGPKAMRT
jgi:DNA-binding transcriptional MocR family regulator